MRRPLFTRALLTLVALAAAAGCRGASFDQLAIDANVPVTVSPGADDDVKHTPERLSERRWNSALAALQSACDRTGGRWHGGMLQCMCPRVTDLFFEDEGCRAAGIEPYIPAGAGKEGREWLAGPALASLAIYVDNTSDLATGRSLTELLVSDPFAPFRGLVIPAAGHRARMEIAEVRTLRLFWTQLGSMRSVWQSPLPQDHFLSFDALLSTAVAPLEPTFCAAAVAAALGEGVHRTDVETTCRRLWLEWQRMVDPERDDYSHRDWGDECAVACEQTVHTSRQSFGATSTIYMHRYLPVGRVVKALGAGGHDAMAYVAPSGRVMAINWSWTDYRPTGSSMVDGRYHEVLFDSSLNALDSSTKEWSVDTSAFPWTPARRSTERGAGLKAMLFEPYLSPEDARMWPQYNLSATVAAGRTTSAWIAGENASEADVSRVLAADYAAAEFDVHGNAVAEAMLSDLPGVEFAGLPYDVDTVSGDPAVAFRAWDQSIKRYAPAVVNMSLILELAGQRCEDSIGRLIAANPEILFVAAVGNNGLRHGVNLCPASLWHEHPNLLTVAGSDGHGSLAGSNHGPELAMVAADGWVVVTRGSGETVRHQASWGTSFAAPHVANLALKMLLKNSQLTPPQLIAGLQASCSGEGLDVTCGGEVSESALIAAGLIEAP